MTHKDLGRLQVLQKVADKELSQVEAARLLKITDRQVRKLVKRLTYEGPTGIISRLVGRSGNRNKPYEIKQRILALLREKYEGFGPTLATEKLSELDGIKISAETTRKWMIEHHLWEPRKIRKKIHLPRARRECFGELIQADGSPHRWFGPEEPEVNATVFIDDATSALTGLYFSETETLEGYFKAFEQHLRTYGCPLALYTDHSTIFHSYKEGGETQMQKALDNLNIELILANSPQAKGRVERANRTLQDRLLKEFRLRGIKTIEQANQFAPEFMQKYNTTFSKKPMSAYDAHRSLEGYDLERILCRKEERSLDSSAIFHFNNVCYQVQGVSDYRRINKQKVEIRKTPSVMRVFLKDQEVKVLALSEIIGSPKELDRKEVLTWKPREYKPGPLHPWKRFDHHKKAKTKKPWYNE